MEALSLFVPIRKVDEAQRLVFGVAAQEVPDRSGEIMDYATSAPQFAKWSAEMVKDSGGKSKGNLRAMHGKVAAGRLDSLNCNDADKAIEIAAKVVDDDEWKKVTEGVYTGFSMGGRYLKRWADPDDAELTRYTAEPQEISLVDRPCIPTATFDVIKADGAVETREFAKAPEDKQATDIKPKKAEIVLKPFVFDATLATADKAAAVNPDLSVKAPIPEEDGGQVWICKRDGATFKHKDELRAHLAKLDAEAAAKEAAGPAEELLERMDKLADKLGKKDYSDDERKTMAHSGDAMSDGSYPIKTASDVANAVKDWNRTGQSPDVKKHILRRATDLGALDKVPDDWRGDTSAGGDTKAAEAVVEKASETEPAAKADEPDLEKVIDFPAFMAWLNDISKAGARHSAADMDHLQSAHDALVKCGAMCAKDDGGDMTMAAGGDDLAKVESELQKALAKVASFETVMGEVAKRLKHLEDMPMPLPISGAARSVTKAEDSAAEMKKRESDLEAELMKLPEGQQALATLRIKKAQSQPFNPFVT